VDNPRYCQDRQAARAAPDLASIDEAILECAEALHTQQIRDRFFTQLRELLAGELSRHRAG